MHPFNHFIIHAALIKLTLSTRPILNLTIQTPPDLHLHVRLPLHFNHRLSCSASCVSCSFSCSRLACNFPFVDLDTYGSLPAWPWASLVIVAPILSQSGCTDVRSKQPSSPLHWQLPTPGSLLYLRLSQCFHFETCLKFRSCNSTYAVQLLWLLNTHGHTRDVHSSLTDFDFFSVIYSVQHRNQHYN